MTPSTTQTHEVFRSARTEVRLGFTAAGAPIITKSPAAAIPDASELARYRRERALLDALAGPGIPRVLELVERGTLQLVMGYQGGRSLSARLGKGRPPIADSLDILEEAASILARVHAAGVIHRDVNPANLVWGGRPGTLQLIDFGNAVGEGEATTPNRLDGTLRYIAPEATGRSGHPVTWRTDLYGLGVTGWHLLVGRPPFEDESPLALIHAHLARRPEWPHRVNPEVPHCLSAVVMRLLEKDPARRYQGAEGLVADLRRCRRGILAGDPSPFELGTEDVPPRFALPHHLYGREAELAALEDALARTHAGGVPLTLVEGPSGIGKSALVEALVERSRRAGVRVVRGRFELLGRDTPLKAITEVCEQLVAELIGLDEGALSTARDALRMALGDSAGLLATSIPALAAVLGKVDPSPPLEGHPAAVRALQAYASLLAALARPDRPVVAFVDDLQWADNASVDLLEFLVCSPAVKGLLLVGAYRDDEVGPGHPITRMRERIESAGTQIICIRPAPMDLASTTRLVAEACRCPDDTAAPLASALRERTGGNPFFLREVLRQMSDRGILRRHGVGWTWDLDAPHKLTFAGNVVDAVLERLSLLPADATHALGVAARIGHHFDIGLLAAALEQDVADVARSLAVVVDAGLIRPDSEAWGWLAFDTTAEATCSFVHDRVQEAALRLLPSEEGTAIHLRLARLLTRDAQPAGQTVFDALEHYRAALPLLTDSERIPVAQLAVHAAEEAVHSGSFGVALRACELGLTTLGRRDPVLWEILCTRAIEAADASADEEALAIHTAALITGASSVAATAPAYVARVRMLTRTERFAEALRAADEFLSLTGRHVDTEVRAFRLVGTLLRVLWAMRGRSAEALINAPEATDPTEAAVLAVRIAAAKALVSLYPKVIPLDILTSVHHVLTHGATAEGLFAWSGWALLVAEGLHRPDLAAPFCELALARAERMRTPTWVGVAWVYYSVLYQWQHSFEDVAKALFHTRERSFDVGEFWAGLAAGLLASEVQFFQGALLSEVELSLRHNLVLARQYRTTDGVASINAFCHVVDELRGIGDPQQTVAIEGPPGGDGTFAQQDQAIARLLLASFLGDREAAWNAAREVPASLNTPLRGPGHFVWWTYRIVALLRAAEAGFLTADEARRMARSGRKLLERWVRPLPARRYRLLWIDATDQALRGDRREALRLFEQAIDVARSDGIRHDASLIAEHAAEVAALLGQPRLRATLLEEACAGYRLWGAEGKADQLALRVPPAATTARITSTSGASGDLDLEALLRASVALSGELRLDHLAGEVVAVAIQNAGATRGFLVSERDGQLFVDVGLDAEALVLVVPGTPLVAAVGLAASVVRYVARTGQPLVLADGGNDTRFASDPHLRGSSVSILCAPLDHNGRRAGIVYLENHIVTGCFTPDRLRTVQVLAAQAAVAIQNANLVDTLEAKVAERTHALESQHQQLIESHRALATSEKMASLGQLVAGVAHELNTPLGAIGASVGNISATLDRSLDDFVGVLSTASPSELEHLRALLAEGTRNTVALSSREERDVRSRLQQQLDDAGVPDARSVARKLVSIGVTDAVDAHLPLLRSARAGSLLETATDLAALRRNSSTIRTAVDRAAKIVFALKSYAHPGSAGGESVNARLADNLNTVLTLYENQMKHGVDLVRVFDDPGQVWGRHDELNQVWTNLIHNALQAMQYRGRLELRLTRDGDHARVDVIDSGPGIPEAVVSRVFEPFYTTKAQGEGSGLGLSISSEIVGRHGGTITVVSRPGRTAFTVTLQTARPPDRS